MILFTSAIIWLLETGKYWFVMHAFPFEVSFFALMLMNGIVNLATTIPSAPGYVGTFDAPGIALLTAYSVPNSIAVGYTLVLHVALWLPITALGAYYFAREGLKWGKVPEESDESMTTDTTDQGEWMTGKNIAIIGAGMGGMAAAWDLIRAGNQVTIYEGSDVVGGLAGGFKEPNWDWSVEKFYHHWFQTDKHILGLIRELGLQDKVLFPRPYTVMYHNGKFYPFDAIPQMILFPGLGWGINKIRFGLVGLFLRLTTNWKALETTTVEKWMRKWAGESVYKSMWEPMLIGKFGERFARQVNMAWMWARLHSRTTRLGTFEGGFQQFCNIFADKLRELGVVIQLKTPIQTITPTTDGKVMIRANGVDGIYDQCLVTTSPGLMAQMAPDLPEDYLRGLLDLKSLGAVVMVLSLNQPLSTEGYYWYNIPKSAGFPFLAIVEHTNFLPPEHFGGDRIVYIGDYLEPDHENFQLSEEALLHKFLPGIQRINPGFNKTWIKKIWLNRTKYAQPVPFVNHSENIPAIQTPIAGLFFASMSQVYPWDRGTNFAVEIGRKAAGLMMVALKKD